MEPTQEGDSTVKTSFEDELEAMKGISTAFAKLDDGAKSRVLSWIGNRFGVSAPAPFQRTAATRIGAAASADATDTSSAEVQDFSVAAELFAAASPKLDTEKALVLGYWFQVHEQQQSFTSRQLNDELKDIGHGVGNITRALDGLIDQKPQLVLQLEKAGKSKQAQKKFKLTHEGIKRVQAMIKAAAAPAE